MIFDTLEDFAANLPDFGAIIGVDFGSKTIGIATSDVMRSIASPLTLINRKSKAHDLAAFQDALASREAVGIIYGMPLQMDGTEGERAMVTRMFAERMAEAIDLPMTYWDERLSTTAVERILIGEADLSRAKRKKVVDKSAAAFILQGALDRMGMMGR